MKARKHLHIAAFSFLLALIFVLPISAATEVTGAEDYFSDGFDIASYVSVGKTDGMKIVCNVWPEESEIDEYYRKLAEQGGYYDELTDRTTKGNDTLCIDYIGRSVDGKEIVDRAENASIKLSNDNGYVSGFDVGLYGISPGKTVKNSVTYPDDYKKIPALAGKTVEYEITVRFIYDYRFTDNDVYVYTKGKHKTVDDFRKFIGEYLATDRLRNYESTLYGLVSDELQVRSTFTGKSLPESQIDFYIRWTKANSDTENTEEELRALAEIQVREDLCLAAYLKQNGIVFDEALYKKELKSQSDAAGYSQAEIESYFGGKDYCRIALMKDYAIRFALEKSEIVTDREQYLYLIDSNKTSDTGKITYTPGQNEGSNDKTNLYIIIVSVSIAAIAVAAVAAVYIVKKRRRK